MGKTRPNRGTGNAGPRPSNPNPGGGKSQYGAGGKVRK